MAFRVALHDTYVVSGMINVLDRPDGDLNGNKSNKSTCNPPGSEQKSWQNSLESNKSQAE